MVNEQWTQIFNINMVKHLARTTSDHRPLLLKSHNDHQIHSKYFRFLNFWTKQPEFLDVVQQVWSNTIEGNPMWILQSKLKLLSRRLSQWSMNNIGDIHEKVNSWEVKMLILEDIDLHRNTEHDREELNKGHAEYIRWLGLQDNLLIQKTQTTWFKEGDYNSKYFHSILRDRRRRLHLHRIKNHRDVWIQGEDKIAKVAIKYFRGFFNLNQQTRSNSTFLNCIPTIILTMIVILFLFL